MLATFVTPGIDPPIMRTTPNSPSVWAKPRVSPAAMPRLARGMWTRVQTRQGGAPWAAQASSCSWGTLRRRAPPAPRRMVGREPDQQVEADHGRRQHQGKGDKRLDDRGDPAARRVQP